MEQSIDDFFARLLERAYEKQGAVRVYSVLISDTEYANCWYNLSVEDLYCVRQALDKEIARYEGGKIYDI